MKLKNLLEQVHGSHRGKPVAVDPMPLLNLLKFIEQDGKPLSPEQQELKKRAEAALQGKAVPQPPRPGVGIGQRPTKKVVGAQSLTQPGKSMDFEFPEESKKPKLKEADFGKVRDANKVPEKETDEGPWHKAELEEPKEWLKLLKLKENQEEIECPDFAKHFSDTDPEIAKDKLYQRPRYDQRDHELEAYDRQNKIYDDQETSLDMNETHPTDETYDRETEIYDNSQENIQERELDAMTPKDEYPLDQPKPEPKKEEFLTPENYSNRTQAENNLFAEWVHFMSGNGTLKPKKKS